MDQKVVQKIGKYEVVGELGQGGMGVVYKARDPNIGRLVAIKTITPDLVSDPEVLKRFYREAQAAGTLQHPNIVTIHDLGEADGCPYIVMEFVEGQSLKDIINRRSNLPLATKLKLVQQFCEGLSHAHKSGFVHRDVKPANILLTKAGVVKVVDFGIVHLDTQTLTKTGMFLGTVHYASPEQVEDGKVDSRSDLWSVACVIYELIAYKKPFDGQTITAVIAKILNSDPEPLSRCSPDSPPVELDAVISKALKKSPEERYQSLDEMLGDLLPLARGLQMTFIADLLGGAAGLRDKGDLDGAQEKVRAALYLDNTHAEAKRLQSEITAALQRLPPEVKAKKLVAEAEQAFGRGEYAAALQALGEAHKLIPLDAQALDLQDKALREQKLASERREASLSGPKPPASGIPGEIPEPEGATSLLEASPLAAQRPPRARSHQPPLPPTPPSAGQQPARRPSTGAPTPRMAAPAPQVSARRQAPERSPLVWVGVALLVVILGIGAYVFLRPKPPTGPTVEETRLEAEAQGLQDTGDLPTALAKWTELDGKNGALKSEADRAIGMITQKLLQEKDLYNQARAAEDQKRWDEAIALYKKVAALNGPLKDQAFNAIPIVMQLQRGMDVSKIEEQEYQQADDALKRNDYSLARSLFQLVISLNVPNSSLAPKAQAAVADIDQSAKARAAFDAADHAENTGDLKGALAQFENIANSPGPLAARAKERIPKLNDMINNAAAQQAFNAALQAENNGDLNGALAQFKVIVEKPGPFAQDAQTHIDQINGKLSAAAARQQFDAADRAQSAGDLKGALAQFKSLAESSEPMKAQAQARVQEITQLLKLPPPATPPSVTPPPTTSAAHKPAITLMTSGDLQPYPLPWHKGVMVSDNNVDGGLKSLNLTVPPQQGAPPGSLVMVMINIDESGNVAPDRVVTDTCGCGPQVREAARSWKFRPPTAKGKPVMTSVTVKVAF